MRFSYIDSQGKEIEVDSVESLALRIEVGAIQPDTRMYDAVADRWAPAEEHPVFRSLSRGEEISEDDVVHIGDDEGAPSEETAEPEAEEDVEEVAEADAAAGDDEPVEAAGEGGDGDAVEEAEPEPAEADDGLGLDFDVTLSDEEKTEEEPSADATAESEGPAAGSEPDGKGEPEEATEVPDLQEPATAEEGEGEPEEDFFEGMDTLELEESEDAGTEGEEAVAGEPADGAPGIPEGGAEGPGPTEAPEEEETPAAASNDEDLPPWAAQEDSLWEDEPESGPEDREPAAEAGPGSSPDGQQDQPLPDPVERMPEWAAEEEVEEEAPPEAVEEPRRERPEPAPRPDHWDERTRARDRRTLLVKSAVAVAVLVVLGGGAAYMLDLGPLGSAGTGEAAEEPARPTLPAELRSVMERLSTGAFQDVLDRFRGRLADRELSDRPPETWLEGRYLSTAGDFPEVPAYWEAVREAIDELRTDENLLFREQLDTRLEGRTGEAPDGAEGGSLSAAEASQVREVALFEYRTTAPERDSVYRSVLDVAEASLSLHELLVERQDEIAYEPFSDPRVSRDPVLEAVPTDSVLRAEMNDRLDQVLDAISDANLPRPVTTASLVDHLLGRLDDVGVLAPSAGRTSGEEGGA